MKLILLENVKKLGTIGQKVNVKDGYGRNFLLKKGKAILPTKENIEHFESKKAEIIKKNEIEKNKALEISGKLKSLKISIKKEIMENGNLYGSVTIKELCTELFNSTQLEIKPEQVEINTNIKSKGEYKFAVNLHADVQSVVLVEVTAKE
ncbi:50S ribosomal protein L9 [Pelagibacteraceae bacterium]|nr:50S ribosomal protein L9 [Pelagibacteraceae bacterium]